MDNLNNFDWSTFFIFYAIFMVAVIFLANVKNRCVGCWFFGAVVTSPFVCTTILLFLSKLSKDNVGTPTQSIDYQGEKNLNNDSYLIYLTKKYKVEFNSGLNKFVCDEKLFTTSEEALAHAHEIDATAKQVKKSTLDKDNYIICATCTGKNPPSDKTCRYCRTELVI